MPKARSKKALDVALRFVELINSHDVEGLSALMTDDHIFIDSCGDSVKGRSRMINAWKGYFEWIPD